MKNLRTEQVVETKKVVASVVCNCCGKTNDVEHTMGGDINEMSVHFGYGSKYDLSIWELDICDDCLDKWRNTFKHPVKERTNTDW